MGENNIVLVFYESKTVSGSNIACQIHYEKSFNRVQVWIDGLAAGYSYLGTTLSTGDKLRIEREGASMFVYADGVELRRFFTDPNLDLHPGVKDATGWGDRNRCYVSFNTKGGLTDNYFENLPGYITVTPENYFPQSPDETGLNYTHSYFYDGKGEGSGSYYK